MLANNLANASTSGYKTDREAYGLYAASEAVADSFAATMPVVEREWTDFSPGTVRPTGNPLDLAIDGAGFFGVNAPGGTLYTRNGAFQLLADGSLATADGYAVRGTGGAAIKLDPTRPFEVLPDGSVKQNGQTAGKIELVDFAVTSALFKQRGTYFRAGAAPQAASSARVGQGKLENSNVGAAESAVRLISVLRQFEMLQKAISLGSEMDRHAVEDVARVGS